jgi:type II secretory pathway component PulF
VAVFGYRATDRDGRVSEGVVEAAGEGPARDLLRARGVLPIRVWPASASAGGAAPEGASVGGGGNARRDVLPFLHGLHTMLRAGIPVDRGLEMLADLFRGKPMGRVAAALLGEVRAGASLSEAMKKAPGAPFDRFTVQMVNAGAATGRMEEAIDQTWRFLERAREFRSSVASALIYPAILLVACLLSVVLMLVFVVPKFAGVFASSKMVLPLPTRIVIGASDFLKADGPWLLGALVAAGFAANAMLERPAVRRDWDRSKFRWPILGDVVTAVETSRVLRSLSSLLSGGVPILPAFVIAREVSGNTAVREGMEAARLKIQGGGKVGRSLAETTPFPEMAIRMISVGEETGRLEEMLASVAESYEAEARRTLSRFLVVLEPAMILTLGGLVAFIVAAVFLAIFRLNEMPL